MSARILRVIALVILVSALAWWLGAGANRGWTKFSVPVKRTDEVTGLSVDDWQKRFIPGVDFLGAGLLVAAGLATASFALRKKPIHT